VKYIQLIRVKQWVKNGFLFIPLFFSGDLFNFSLITDLSLGFLAFSFMASTVYILNDYRDIEADKIHPAKKNRPLASGKVSKTEAIVLLCLFLVLGSSLALFVKIKFAFVLGIYFVMNVMYSLGLKKIAILDMIIISIGFVLRIKAGGVIADIAISQWLMVMVFLLALFLAIAKRRDDIVLKMEQGIDLRKSVKNYNIEFLNSILTLISGIVIVAYLMYTLNTEVMRQFGTYRLYYTVVFVIAGILRYMQLAMVENNTGSPTELLYKDRVLQLAILGWLISYYLIIYYPDISLFE
jgi:decaprenyl-phosphate phosphoribosyltransferase